MPLEWGLILNLIQLQNDLVAQGPDFSKEKQTTGSSVATGPVIPRFPMDFFLPAGWLYCMMKVWALPDAFKLLLPQEKSDWALSSCLRVLKIHGLKNATVFNKSLESCPIVWGTVPAGSALTLWLAHQRSSIDITSLQQGMLMDSHTPPWMHVVRVRSVFEGTFPASDACPGCNQDVTKAVCNIKLGFVSFSMRSHKSCHFP